MKPWIAIALALATPPRPAEPPAATAAMSFAPPQTVELTLPFQGVWGVIQGFDNGRTHVGYAAYALDFVPVKKTPMLEPRTLGDFPCYGKRVLASADGVVVSARGGAVDHRPWTTPAYDAGNFVIVKHAEATYTELRHLKAGSVRVAVGDRVRRGQPIGRCGNSGTSSTPHLHVGLLGSANPIATRMLAFSRYEVLGPDGAWEPGGGIPQQGQILRPVH